MCGRMQYESVMMVIIQIITVPVLLHQDQIHLNLLAITTTVNLATQELITIIITTHLMPCGMDMVVIILIITAVPTLICLGSSDNFHVPCMIILKQESAVLIRLVVMILLWKTLNCTYSNINIILTDAFTTDTLTYCI